MGLISTILSSLLWSLFVPSSGVEVVWTTKGDVPIVDFDGLKPYLERKDGKTYVVNFWATWCSPCIKELPYFEELLARNQENGVELILVSLDFPRQIVTKLMPFLEKHQLKGEVVVLDDPDANSWIDKVDPGWSGAIPATLVYQNDKRSFHERSFKSYDELFEILKPYLNNQP